MQPTDPNAEYENLLANLPATENDVLKAVYALEERDERQRASALLERAIERYPCGLLRRALAERCIYIQEHERARALMDQQANDDTGDGAALLLLARAYNGLDQPARALESLERARARGIAADRVAFWAEKIKPVPASGAASPDEDTQVRAGLQRPADNDDDLAGPQDETMVGVSPLANASIRASGGFDRDDLGPEEHTHIGSIDFLDDPGADTYEADELSQSPLREDAGEATDPLKAEVVERLEGKAAFANEDELPTGRRKPQGQSRTSISHQGTDPRIKHVAAPDSAQELQRWQSDISGVGLDQSLDLDIDPEHDFRGKPRPGHARPLPPAPGQRGEQRDDANAWASVSEGRGTRSLARLTSIQLGGSGLGLVRILAIALAGMLAIVFVTAGFFSSSEINRLRDLMGEANSAQALDLYPGYVQALVHLDATSRPSSYLGSTIDELLFTKMPLPGLSVPRWREMARADHALVAALVEQRFEHPGSRAAAHLIARAPAYHPHTAAAGIYEALASDKRDRALELALKARKFHPGDPVVREAVAEVLLLQDKLELSRELAATLATLSAPTLRERYALARLQHQLGDGSAPTSLRAIIQEHSAEHVGAHLALAKSLGARPEEHAQAQATLRSVVTSLAPNAAPLEMGRAFNAIGHFFAQGGDAVQAEANYRKAVAAAPQHSNVYPPLIALFQESARFDDARKVLAQVSPTRPPSPYFAITRCELFLLSGMASQALQVLEGAEDSGQIHWLRGLAQLQLGDPGKAIESFQAAAKAKPNPPAASAFALYAGARSDDTKTSAALAAIKKLGVEHPGDAAVHRANGLIHMHEATLGPSRSRHTQLVQAARKSFEQALITRPNDTILLHDRCQADIALRDAVAAKASCERARRANPEYLPGMIAIAHLHMLEGNYDLANTMLQDLRLQHPLNARLSLTLARTQIGRGQLDRASEEVNRWLGEPAHESAEWMLVEGRIAFARREYTKALGYFQRAHESPANTGEAVAFLGTALARLGHIDRADALLRDALSHPTYGADSWMALGQLRRRQDRFADANTNLTRALQHFEAQIASPRRLAQVHAELARAWQIGHGWTHPNVLRHIELGQELAGNDEPDWLHTFGLYQLAKRKPEQALAQRAFERAVEIDRFHCESWQALLRIYNAQRAGQSIRSLRERMPAVCAG
ncbi:MAG: hypothetical protein H0U74_06155 [Bradymonadaceae bacterium]|nr:hypothetical protein [Lujinxingiaceae bacterium]